MAPLGLAPTSVDLQQWLSVLVVAFVAMGMAAALLHSAGETSDWSRRARVVSAALLTGSAVWCMHFLAAFSPQKPLGVSLDGLSMLAWVLAVASAVPVHRAGFGPGAGRLQQLVASIGFGMGVCASQALSFTTMHTVPAAAQGAAWALALIGSVGLGSALALEVQRLSEPGLDGLKLRLGATLVASLSLSAHNFSGIVGHWEVLLAIVGFGGLMVSLAAFSAVEGRVRNALSSATTLVEQSSQTDATTALPNRAAMEQKLARVARSAAKRNRSIALLCISLDNLKSVTDTFGREAGEALLQAVARRLEALAPRHYLARLSSDEFGLLLAVDAEEGGPATLAARVITVLQSDFTIESHRIAPRCSVGIVECPLHGEHTTMLTHGEAAVRAARQASATAPVVFKPQMLDEMRDQLELLADLRGALAAGQMELHYQPKIHAPSGDITGAEALMRWKHPRRGPVPPSVFIPLAERHNLIDELGNWVIDEACRQARVWRDEGLRMRVSINLSVCQLRQPDLAARIARALEKHQINPQLLTCEITESLAMEDSATTIAFFAEIAKLRVRLSIDDFGTGYSSLSYLRKLPAEELKIDRSFVLDLGTSPDARAVVDAVVKLAHALGLKVVAEGVETELQSEILRELGCHELQGFLFAKPMTAKALGQWALKATGPKALKFRPSLFRATSVVGDGP